MGKSPFRRNTIVRKFCDRINKLQNPNDGIDTADEIFTIPIASTPTLGEIYNEACNGIMCEEGLSGPSLRIL